jgi:subtilase family serine protease
LITPSRSPRLALLIALLLTAAPSLPACDDSTPTQEDNDTSGGQFAVPSVNIDDLELPVRRGSVPFTVDMTLTLSSGDPRADVTVFFDFGDGKTEDRTTRTRLSLTPDPDNLAEYEPEKRSINITHTYDAVGIYQLRINAVDVTNSTDPDPSTWIQAAELVFDISVDGLSDLQAASVGADVTALRPDELFNISYEVRNGGDDLSAGFDTALYLVSQPDVTTASLLDSTVALKLTTHSAAAAGLPGGEVVGEKVPVSVTAAQYQRLTRGTWYVAMVVDPVAPGSVDAYGAIREENELNNLRVSTVGLTVEDILTPPELSLVTADAVVAPTSAPLLRDLTVRGLKLRNSGELPSAACDLKLYMSEDEVIDVDDRLLASFDQVPVIDPDGTWDVPERTFTFSPNLTTLGSYYVIAEIDPSLTSNESEAGRANNTQILPQVIQVTGVPPRDIDLEPSDITAVPSTTFVGGLTEISFRVKNNGADDAGQFICKVYLSADQTLDTTRDIEATNIQIETLIAGQRRTFNRFVNITTERYVAGTYYPFVVCDADRSIIETNEDNNTVGPGTEITVFPEPQINYTISELTVTPNAVDISNITNDTITVTAQVCNEGTDPAEPPLIELRLSPDDILSDNDLSLGTDLLAVPSLAPGACAGFSITRKANCLSFVSGYRVALEVDPDGQFNEINEDDNVGFALQGGAPQQISVGGPRCFCADDRFDPPGGGTGNSTPAQATDLTALLQPSGNLRELTARADNLAYCGSGSGSVSERDLYKVDLIEGDRITIGLSFNQPDGDLDLRLYDAADLTTPIAESLGVTGQETIVHTTRIDPSTSVYIEVMPKNPGESNYYALDLTVLNAPTEPDLSIPSVTLTSGQNPFDLNNYDFSMQLSNAGRSPADVPVRVYLSTTATYNPASPPARVVTPTPDPIFNINKYSDLTLDFTTDFFAVDPALPAGTYYLIAVADPANAVVESNEANNVRVSSAITLDTDCPSDVFDAAAPNDTFPVASVVRPSTGGLPSIDDLAVCNDGRDDVYKVCIPASANLNHVGLYQVARNSALQLALFDAAQSQISTSNSSANNVISVNNKAHNECSATVACASPETCVAGRCQDASGDHCIYARVRITNNAVRSLRYNLLFDTSAPEYSNEPTNTVGGGASSLPDSLRTLAKGGPGAYTNPSNDRDWYTIPINGGTPFTVTLDAADRNARINYRPGTITASPTVIFPGEPRALTAPGLPTVASPVYFEVFTTNPTGGTNRTTGYTLTVDGVQGIDLTPRNATLTPTTSQRNGSTNLSWDLVNERLDPTPVPVHFRYLLSDDAVASDDDIPLYTLETDDVSPGTIGSLANINIQQKVYFREAAANNTFLPFDEAIFGDFQLLIDVNPPINAAGDHEIDEISFTNNTIARPVHLNHVCVTDTIDGSNSNANASPASATLISPIPYASPRLSICNSDLDYYRLTIPANTNYEVIVDGMVATPNADLDVIVYANDANTLGNILGFSTGTNTASERVTITNASASPLSVFIEVAGFQPSYTNVYFLSVNPI